MNIVIITGASRGLGASTAIEAARRGMGFDMTRDAFDQMPAFETKLAGQTALGRIGEPGDVGRVVAGLLSPHSGWINAQNIEVAGGYNI